MKQRQQNPDRMRYAAYVIIALLAMIVGMLLGQLGSTQATGVSRITWPSPGEVSGGH